MNDLIHKSHNALFPHPTMHHSQCTIKNRNVHISVLNGVLWDMEQVYCVICEIGLLIIMSLNPGIPSRLHKWVLMLNISPWRPFMALPE